MIERLYTDLILITALKEISKTNLMILDACDTFLRNFVDK